VTETADEQQAEQESSTPSTDAAETMAPASFSGGRNFDQLMPVILFFGFRAVLGNLILAVVASTLWSIKAAVSRKRRGLNVGKFLPGISIYLLLRAGLTVAVDERWIDVDISGDAVYFGFGIVGKIIIGIWCMMTIFAGRPLLGWLVPKLVKLPATVIADPRYKKAMSGATWFVVGFELLSSVWDTWLYNNSGIGFFIATRTGVNFLASFAFITGAIIYMDRTLERVPDYPGITKLMEDSGRVRS
jgi:hypothetical protein